MLDTNRRARVPRLLFRQRLTMWLLESRSTRTTARQIGNNSLLYWYASSEVLGRLWPVQMHWSCSCAYSGIYHLKMHGELAIGSEIGHNEWTRRTRKDMNGGQVLSSEPRHWTWIRPRCQEASNQLPAREKWDYVCIRGKIVLIDENSVEIRKFQRAWKFLLMDLNLRLRGQDCRVVRSRSWALRWSSMRPRQRLCGIWLSKEKASPSWRYNGREGNMVVDEEHKLCMWIHPTYPRSTRTRKRKHTIITFPS